MIRLLGIVGGLLVMVVMNLGASPCHAQRNLFQKVLPQAQRCMVKVLGAGVANVEGYASGTLVSDDGLIVSTQGVFLDGRQVQVILADGSMHVASILRRDRQLQLSLLKIEAETPDFFPLGDQDYGEQGDWVAAISNAYRVADKEEALTVMMGVISLRTSIDAKLNQRDTAYSGPMVLVDAITSNPGAAGGALIDQKGRLVGVIGKIINSTETNTRLNYAVPRSRVYSFVQGETSDSTPTARTSPRELLDLGLKVFQLSGRNAPPYVDRVVRGGLADQAGVKPDDLIVSINGTKLSTVRDYLNAKEKLYDDQPVVLLVTRGSDLKRLVVWEPNQTSDRQNDRESEGDGSDNQPPMGEPAGEKGQGDDS